MTNTLPRARGTPAFALFYRLRLLKAASGRRQHPSWSTRGVAKKSRPLLLEGDPPATAGEADLTFDLEEWGGRFGHHRVDGIQANWSVGRLALRGGQGGPRFDPQYWCRSSRLAHRSNCGYRLALPRSSMSLCSQPRP
jgi:hypothetical protein